MAEGLGTMPMTPKGKKDIAKEWEAAITAELAVLDKSGSLICPGCKGRGISFKVIRSKKTVEPCESCERFLCMGCLMKSLGSGFGTRAAMNTHTKTCAHIQGRGKEEWTATKQSFMRNVGESLGAEASEEDKKRRMAAFGRLDSEVILNLGQLHQATLRRSRRGAGGGGEKAKEGLDEDEQEEGREGLGVGIQALGLDSGVKGVKVGDNPHLSIVEEQAQGLAPPSEMAMEEEIAGGSEAGGHPGRWERTRP